MKKIFVLCVAAIVALGAFSCQKDDVAGIQTPEFNKEGLQKYTFTVSGVETKMTYVTDKTNHKITPKWAVGDTIYVYGSDDAYFEVTDVADNGSATVVGYAQPGSGNLTLIYSPCITSGNQSNFNLIDQKGHLDKDFPAIYYGSVNLGTTPTAASFNLKTFILEISNVKGISNGSVINSIIVEGTNIAKGTFGSSDITGLLGEKVIVSLTDWTGSSNVVCADGTLPESVFISLAPGSISKITVKTNNNVDYIWQPSPAVTLNAGTYKYVSEKTFTLVYPGTNISAVKVGNLWWAPVNCGGDYQLYSWNDAQNCCPSGWRTPTSSELQALVNTGSSWSSSPAGRSFNSGTLFFHAAGAKSDSGDVNYKDESGWYWSSTPDGDGYAIYMKIEDDAVHVYNNQNNGYRSRGMSVRCVKSAS